MGAGIAKSIRENFPEAYLKDQNTIKGDRNRLGTYTSVTIQKYERPFIIVNLYGQYEYSREKGPNVNYVSIAQGLIKIKEDFKGLKIGMPKIGCGLAGGSWKVIEAIIESALHEEDVTVVNYKETAP